MRTKEERIQILTDIKSNLEYTMYICLTDIFRELEAHSYGKKQLLTDLRLLDALALCKGTWDYAFLPYNCKSGESRDIHHTHGKSLIEEGVNNYYRYWKVQLCDAAISLIEREVV